MNVVRDDELAELVAVCPGAEIIEGPDNSLAHIPSVTLPGGWSRRTTPIWFAIPVGYPAAQPDCFWADASLTLASGAQPANSGAQSLPMLGTTALWFSWHLASWQPSRDRLLTYLRFILTRLADVR